MYKQSCPSCTAAVAAAHDKPPPLHIHDEEASLDLCASYRELVERARGSLVDMRKEFDAQAAQLEAERAAFKQYKLKAKRKARGQDRANQMLREALRETKVSLTH